jgi:DNA-binding NarL/FixJ family response regulator
MVVGDSAAVRSAICQFIDRATSFKACCDTGHGFAAVDKAIERAPNLVILDLSTTILDGVETASVLRRMIDGIKIIGLAMFPLEEVRRTLITSAGFDMIVSKHEGLEKLGEAIKALLPSPT